MANYTSSLNDYIKNLITDVLPVSDLINQPLYQNGLRNMNASNSVTWSIELPNSVEAGLYLHEKSSTTRLGVLIDSSKPPVKAYHSHYFKPFPGGIMKAYDSLIAQSVLELYPTPVQTYGAVCDERIASGGVIDLNYLRTKDGKLKAQACRFDMLLNSMGFGKEINSFYELQCFLKDPKVQTMFSDRALTQLALCTYFIPNAIGEVDANSRNIIVIKDPISQKIEYVARIDAESNTYFNTQNNERSGKNILPKGIFHGNEFFESEFLKAITEKQASIDWDLFASFTFLASKIASTNRIDDAIFSGHRRNLHMLYRYPDVRPTLSAERYFGQDSYMEFSKASIDRAKRYHDNVFTALGRNYVSRFPFENMEKRTPNKLEMIPLKGDKTPLTPQEETELGLS